jgi:hypothetical protein
MAEHVFATWQARAGLDRRLHFHSFRHTSATKLLRATGNLRLVQPACRHSHHLRDRILLRVHDWLSNQRKKRVRRGEVVLDEDVLENASAPSERGPVRLVEDKRDRETCWAKLCKELEGDAVASGVLRQIEAGVDEPADQARALAIAVEEIYKANRRIQYAGQAIARAVRR